MQQITPFDKNQKIMENNENIPNVSSVFRELIKISTTNPRLNSNSSKDQLRSNNNHLPSKTYQYSQCSVEQSFPSNIVESERHQRHQALMSRLKNSLQQNRQLLGVQYSPFQRNQMIQGSVRVETNVQAFNQYAEGLNSYQANGQKEQPKVWLAPKIKYRHIEDLQQKSKILDKSNSPECNMESTLPEYLLNQMKLMNEFYESNAGGSQNKNKQSNFQRSLNQNDRQRQADEQQKEYDQGQKDEQNMNKQSVLSQKPSKYSQNLQSYYEICRKPVKPPIMFDKNTGQKNANTQKFMRRQTPKVEGINLQKAMKILSLDL